MTKLLFRTLINYIFILYILNIKDVDIFIYMIDQILIFLTLTKPKIDRVIPMEEVYLKRRTCSYRTASE
jgi:hypothetical protein